MFCLFVQMWTSALLWQVRSADMVSVLTVWAPSSACVWMAMSSPLTLKTALVSPHFLFRIIQYAMFYLVSGLSH